jgi:hypothetical protein
MSDEDDVTGESLGDYDTDDSQNEKEASHSDDDVEDVSSLDVPEIPLPKRKKNAFSVKYDGSDALYKIAKALDESQKTGEPLDTDIFIPKSTPELLNRLSQNPLITENFEMTMTMNAVVRECEDITAYGAPNATTFADLRRLLRLYDDFALANINRGAKIDSRHRLALFITRMKICSAIDAVDAPPGYRDPFVRDDYWLESRTVSNVELARWFYASRACHPLLLVVDDQVPRTHPQYVAGHLMQHCTLECFWQSLLTFVSAFPYLTMSEFVVAAFEEYRQRAAFFMSYRELATPDGPTIIDEGEHRGEKFSLKKQIDMARTKVLGLSLNLFGLMDLNNPSAEPIAEPIQQTATLLDNVDLVKITDNFIHVNLDFAEECDKLLHAIQLDLRRCAGFKLASTLSSRRQRDCVGCENAAVGGDRHIEAFEKLIEAQVTGTFRTQISEEFRELLFAFYEQPHEVQAFRDYHGYEVITAQNCIAQQRPRDYRILCEKFTGSHCDEVWKTLRGQYDEPAYGVLCWIALNYHTQQHLKGARITTYFVDCCKSGGGCGIKPFEHLDEFAGLRRNSLVEFHVQQTTTGTFLFRNHLINRQGFDVDHREVDYEHPLIVRSMNSYGVYYLEHLHQCRSFGHAFLTWLHIMCTDKCIDAQLATGAFLHQLYAQLFPERFERIKVLAEDVDKRLRQYNPFSQFVDPAIAEANEKIRNSEATQF